jgi:hypothetical protein
MSDERKLRLKRHETFKIREGWIEKALYVIKENESKENQKLSQVFYKNDGVVYLGVGANMVKAIKYWLVALKLIDSRTYKLTDFAKTILKCDEYLDENFTWYLLHYVLIKNEEDAPVFSAIMNEYNQSQMTKESLVSFLSDYFCEEYPGQSPNLQSLESDVSVFLNSYSFDENDADLNPEKDNSCPFASLHLLDKSGKNEYRKSEPAYSQLDYRLVFYVLSEMNLCSFHVDDLKYMKNSPVKVFNLSQTQMYGYLNEMKQAGFIDINRTAGLNEVYINKRNVSIENLFDSYLKEKRG